MPRHSILTEKFVAKIHAELRKPGANMHAVARKLGCSPSTIYRATGGKARLASGKTTVWVESARRQRVKRGNKSTRQTPQQRYQSKKAKIANSKLRKGPQGPKRKLKPRAA